ncbi:uncharacterized protein LOC125503315 [Dendroctonus ponderosae]|uniref:uncharacterized protein LOC125503315 n=1 Tax=Dendroctonus ponderosae TaxID=77166 RepID=UPI002034F646|nr:uncharacterized protein LOC125503315 [Dendroctonus ponderosae]
MAIKKKFENAIIFSDSSSAIRKISRTGVSIDSNLLTLRTSLLIEAKTGGCDIALAWVPGHAGIQGNVVADTLANIGRQLNIPKKTGLDNRDIFNKIKDNILQTFKNDWAQITRSKGSSYRSIQETFPKVNWFAKLPYKNRRHITTIIRMRTGHCSTNQHLYKIKVIDNPSCECGQIHSLNHIFFECPINNNKIYQELIKIGYTAPLNIEGILRKPKISVIELINSFLTSNNIRL